MPPLSLLALDILCFGTYCFGFQEVNDPFRSPSAEYRPQFRYWYPDASISEEILRNDIKNISAIGAGGIELLPFYLYGNIASPDGPPVDWIKYAFASEPYNQHFRAALEETKECGMVMDFALGVNQGQGVPATPGTEGLALELIYGNTTVQAGETYDAAPPRTTLQSAQPFYAAERADWFSNKLKVVLAARLLSTNLNAGIREYVLDEPSIVDITDRVQNGILTWTAPSSNDNSTTYKIIAFWEKYTNERSAPPGTGSTDILGNGSFIVDHFSSTGARRTTDFLDQYVLKEPEVKDLVRSVVKYSWEDSQEHQAALWWTSNFLQEFEARRGYSAARYLPLFYSRTNNFAHADYPYGEYFTYGNYTLTNESVHEANYRTTLNDLYQRYVSHLVQWSESYGIGHSNQPAYNLPLDIAADIRLVSAPETESLTFGDNVDAYLQFSDPAHIAGKQVISTEVGAVQSGAYSQTIPDLLRLFKRSFAGGINMMMIHGAQYTGDYPQTTWPGYTSFYYLFTEQWSNKQPAWAFMRDIIDYTARNQWVLQQGAPRIDLAFYRYLSPWRPDTLYPSNNLREAGYTYEYLGPTNLLLPEAIVENKTLAPNGPSYKALIFYNESSISLEAAQKLQKLANDGLPIIFIDKPTECIGWGQCGDTNIPHYIDSVVSSNDNVYELDSIEKLPSFLQSIESGIHPRSKHSSPQPGLYTVWRTDASTSTDYVYLYNADIFIGAESRTTFSVSADRIPYWLDAWTGSRTPVLQYDADIEANTITIDLSLAPDQTRILAFMAPREEQDAISLPSYPLAVDRDNVSLKWDAQAHKPYFYISSTKDPITLPNGQNITSELEPPSPINLTAWSLELQSFHPTKGAFITNSTATDITIYTFNNTTLGPWTALPNMQNVSGIGVYTTTFSYPAQTRWCNSDASTTMSLVAVLSFTAPVTNTLRVTLNGQVLPPIDLASPEVDISPYINFGGENELKVEVSSTLYKAVQSLASEIAMVGVTAASAGVYEKDETNEVGLWGDVVVRSFVRVDV